MRKSSIVLSLLIIFLATTCKKDGEEVGIESVNFYGCSNEKSQMTTAGCINLEKERNGFIKITHSGVTLNCGVDSITVTIDHQGNTIDIYETEQLDSPAFCDCAMSYDYILGPLKPLDYKVNIYNSKGKAAAFTLHVNNIEANPICN